MKIKRIVFIFIIIITLIIGFALLYIHNSFKNNIPVLAYHSVIEEPTIDTDLNIDKFKEQMKFLYKHNYKTLSLDEYYSWKKGKEIQGKKVVLTFDDGNESFYTNILPILKEYNFNATVFMIVENIGKENYLTEEQIEDIKNNYPNIKIESHSNHLHYQEIARLDDYEIYNEDMVSVKEKGFKYYAYPFGIRNDAYKKALKDNDYKLAFIYSPSKWSSKNDEDYEVSRVAIYNSNSMIKFIIKVMVKF